MFRKSAQIRDRVFAHISKKVEEAQVECENRHLEIEQAFQDGVDSLVKKMRSDKERVVDDLVEGIIGKL